MSMETRTTRIAVNGVGEPLYSELCTSIEIADEADGEFVEVSQSAGTKPGKIQISPEEWPMLRDAIDMMVVNCREYPEK